MTILSKNFIDKMNPSLAPKISPVNINLITATGESSPLLEKLILEFVLETKFTTILC